MNENNNKAYDLSGKIRTVKEGEDFCAEISFVLNNIYNVGNTSIDQILSKHSSKTTAGIIKKILTENKIPPSDFSACEKFLNALIESVKKMKVIKLTLAIEPSDELISRISGWIDQNLEKNTLLEVQKDENILGGAILSLNGKYKDYSLKKSISDLFLDKKVLFVSNISPK